MLSREAWPRILPFAVYISFIVIADLLSSLGVSELRWLYPVKIGAVVILLWYYRHSYTELACLPRKPAQWGMALGIGILVMVLWINLNANWMQIGKTAGFDPRNNGALDWTLVVPRIVGAALVVPVMEELFWRSFLMRWIRSADFLAINPAFIGAKAFVTTAILFGIEHDLWLAGVVAGVAYGALYAYSRNLWIPIVAHAITNGVLGGWIISTSNWAYW